MKVLSQASAKKKTKRLKGFKFRTFMGRFQTTSWQWRGYARRLWFCISQAARLLSTWGVVTLALSNCSIAIEDFTLNPCILFRSAAADALEFIWAKQMFKTDAKFLPRFFFFFFSFFFFNSTRQHFVGASAYTSENNASFIQIYYMHASKPPVIIITCTQASLRLLLL